MVLLYTLLYILYFAQAWKQWERIYMHMQRFDTEALGSRWKYQHPSAPAIVLFFFFGGGAAGLWRQPFLWQRAWCHFHAVWGKKEFMAAPSMPTSAIKLSTGSEAIFWAWRSLPLLALSLFNIMLPALVGNPQRVVPVSLHAATHNETKPGT